MNVEPLVVAEATGVATPAEVEVLQAAPQQWATTLRRLVRETEQYLASAAKLVGDEREQAVADLRNELANLRGALVRLCGPEEGAGDGPDPAQDGDRDGDAAAPALTEPLLQASWSAGQVVLWAGGPGLPPATPDEVGRLVEASESASVPWAPHPPVPLPRNERAVSVAAPLGDALGWLVGVGSGQVAADAAPSLRWLGEVAVWATELVAQGRFVPTLQAQGRDGERAGGGKTKGGYAVVWQPALVEADRLKRHAGAMPGAVRALDPSAGAEALCQAVLREAVNVVCRAGAARLVAPATAPVARTAEEVAEAVLAHADGRPFDALPRAAGEVTDALAKWADRVAGTNRVHLVVRLSPPEQHGGWNLSVEAVGVERHPLPVERAMVLARHGLGRQVEAELNRLERLLPVLRRPGDRRGEVVLSGDEAWELMAETGHILTAVGFDVRVPQFSRSRPQPRLHLTAEGSDGPSQVGIQQLSRVRWSVLFDDLELDAAAINRLAVEARPLVRTKGRWVELDRSDLEAAASALAQQARTTEMTGAAILRHAVGLEGSPLSGGIVADGSGWAVDVVRGATTNPPAPAPAPEGFVGELRSYQAEARGWLAFLDSTGLGGCLALDMGLGKTPTVLAHVLDTVERGGPTLVVTPSAVLGNWKTEAAQFTPRLRVHLHHGPSRPDAAALAELAGRVDVVLTTYGTAVRDVEALAAIPWSRVVVDEAQALKNPASETAEALRRIPATSRLALTGTPIENGLGDLWAILDFANPGLLGTRASFVAQLSASSSTKAESSSKGDRGRASGAENALRALNGLLVFRRTKAEPAIAKELPDKVDRLDHCTMTTEQIGLYQAVLDGLLADASVDAGDSTQRKGQVLAAITALKQICDHPTAYLGDEDTNGELEGRSGKLARLEEIVDSVFAAGERVLVFTHFARWGRRMAAHLSRRTGVHVDCYDGDLSRTERDRMVADFQHGQGPGALVLSLTAGGTGLNLTAASHVVLYDRWWNPAKEDQARDRAWRIGQTKAVVSHRLVCVGTVDERVEEVVAGKRRTADEALSARSELGDLSADQLRVALGLRPDVLVDDHTATDGSGTGTGGDGTGTGDKEQTAA